MEGCPMLSSLVFQADNDLLQASAYVNAARLIVAGLGDNTRGAEIDDALHSLQLVIAAALNDIKNVRSQLEVIQDLVPVDDAPSGEVAT
jgi:hypothetical protein